MSAWKPSAVALIPARSGSKRVPHKNITKLNGHPLIAYTICAARDSDVFDAVIVSTDSLEYAEVARHYGAEVPFLRPAEFSGDTSPDIEWLQHILKSLAEGGRPYDAFALLRPTSPCRKPETIRRAWAQFLEEEGVHSLRAVEKCEQHPGKMWIVRGKRMHPLMPMGPEAVPYHSTQYAGLPVVYVQNASLEIAWSRVPLEMGSIAGEVLTPFLTQGDEGFDVNRPDDWRLLEMALARGDATLPAIAVAPYPG
jgi:CMP-N,N'-diacetyllegionaminic acid synthase